MHRLLAIHYFFPPLGGIGSIRALKFARYLPSAGWEPTVVAPENGFFWRDPSLGTEGLSVVRTPSFEVSRLARRRLMGHLETDQSPVQARGVLRNLQRFVRRQVYRPDAHLGWYPFALSAARGLVREKVFSAVLSSSFPLTAHLVGRRLRRDLGLPWVAEFRDPWTDLRSYDSARRKAWDQRLEASFLREADAVVTVSEGFAQALKERGARRVFVVTNGFDPEDYPDHQELENVVAYLGTYYPGRQDLDTALGAFSELISQGMAPGLRFRFVGEYGPELHAAVRRAGLQEHVDVTGFFPHRAALRVLGNARLLLLLGSQSGAPIDPVARGWIPAKAFEYLGARRPVLYVGDVQSEVADILRQAGAGEIVAPGDHSGAKAAAVRLLARPQACRGDGISIFTRRALAARLALVLDEVGSRAAALPEGGRT
jgi:glycosyltransferase involved in cell wall biosynthesis